jgi:hypothetical protein
VSAHFPTGRTAQFSAVTDKEDVLPLTSRDRIRVLSDII